MIPDEAVEAAVRVMPEYTPEDEADSFDLKANEVLRGKVEMILDAAAPHLTESPAEQAMADIEAHLERWFNGEQTQTAAMAAVARISGRYKMERIK